MKKIKMLLVVGIIITILIGFLSFFLYSKNEEEKRIEQKKLEEKIKSHYGQQVKIMKNTFLYQKDNGKYKKIGKITKDEIIKLENISINCKTKYFFAPDLDAYILWEDVLRNTDDISKDQRYKNYLAFNENIISKDKVHLYRGDKLVYTLYFSINKPIIKKDDSGYYIEYLDELLFVPKDDVERIENVSNNVEEEASEVPVTVYHFIYLEGDNTCNESICHHENQIKEQFQYLKDNNYFTLNTTELKLFLDGKIRLPKKSLLVTIDDGARAEKFIPLLEQYQINATLFLISSWYPKEKFKSNYMEIASHTHNLHTPGVCSGGQGSPLKCLNKEELLSDLKTSRETLDGTEAFCFPFYEFNDYAIDAVKEAGFSMAFIGGMKKVTKNTDPYKIPRISLSNGTTLNEYIRYVQS